MSAEFAALSEAERQRVHSEAYAAGVTAGRGAMLLDLRQTDEQLWEQFFEAIPGGPTIEQVSLVARIAHTQRSRAYGEVSQLLALRESVFLNSTARGSDDGIPPESVGDVCRQLREWLDNRRGVLVFMPSSADTTSPLHKRPPTPAASAGATGSNLDTSFSARLAAKEWRNARQVWDAILNKASHHDSR